MAEAEEQKEDIYSYMCTESLELDDIGQEFKDWRKRNDKIHEKGDWVILCQEPLLPSQQTNKYTWVVGPKNVGKGGVEVACRAAQVLLTTGRLFDIKQDVTKKSPERKATLERSADSYPVAKFPNGKTAKQKPLEDSDDEDEEAEYYGLPCLFAVRFKGEIFTADTMTDTAMMSRTSRMVWASNKTALLQAIGKQAKFHIELMDETKLADGKKIFLDLAKKHAEKI